MSLHETARGILARRGINPDDLPPPEPFDPVAALVENATTALDRNLDARFRDVQPRNPGVRAWVHTFLDDRDSCGTLLLTGPVGEGKSSEAIGALRGCVLGTARRGRRMTWLFASHPDLNAALRPAPNDAHLQALDEASTVDLFVLDDASGDGYTDWAADSLYRIVNARWANNRPMIVTSNLSGPELGGALGARIASRLSVGTHVPLAAGVDLRREESA